MNTLKAEEFFATLTPKIIKSYEKYWNSIKPKTKDDFLRRYLFAFTSVHTTWEGNIRGYQAIKNLDWFKSKRKLKSLLQNSGCGMHNVRTEYIWNFTKNFLFDSSSFIPNLVNDWAAYRDRLVKIVNGIGMAKVSFTLEMCEPLKAQVTCIDTHGIQLYELDTSHFNTKEKVKLYHKAEKHWLDSAKAVNCPPMIARCIYWDKKQNQTDSRYWSKVLEN